MIVCTNPISYPTFETEHIPVSPSYPASILSLILHPTKPMLDLNYYRETFKWLNT